MEVKPKKPPRKFDVGSSGVTLFDCGSIKLGDDEQITFLTELGNEYDVVRKEWGFYATPSLNGRLIRWNLQSALVQNKKNQLFVLLVEKEKEDLFDKYCKTEDLTVLTWLNDSATFKKLVDLFKAD